MHCWLRIVYYISREIGFNGLSVHRIPGPDVCILRRPFGTMCGRWLSAHVRSVLSPDSSALMPFAPESLHGIPAIVGWTIHSADRGLILSHGPVTFWRVYNSPKLSVGHHVTPFPPSRSSSAAPWCSAASVFGFGMQIRSPFLLTAVWKVRYCNATTLIQFGYVFMF